MKYNNQQLEVIEAKDRRVLVVASAGSGKTSVLIAKTINLIKDGNVDPSSILLLTFSNKASKHLKELLQDGIGVLAKQITVSTFHSFALRLMKSFIELLPISPHFKIIGPEERNRSLATIGNELKINSYIIGDLKQNIDGYKRGSSIKPEHKVLYDKLIEKLTAMDLVEINDLIPIAIKLMEEHEIVKKYVQSQFKYLLIDEFQDTNQQQLDLITPIIDSALQFVAVGDDDQCIFEWRGSEPEIMVNLSNATDVRKIFLSQNYRSQGNIINLSNNIIKNNVNRVEKAMIPTIDATFRPAFQRFINEEDEATFIANKIYELYTNTSINLNEIAILVRKETQSNAIIRKLVAKNLPYVNHNISIKKSRWILNYLKELSKDTPELHILINNPDVIINKFTYEDLCLEHKLDQSEFNKNMAYFYDNNVELDNNLTFRNRYKSIEDLMKLKDSNNVAMVITTMYENIMNSGDTLTTDDQSFLNIAYSIAREYSNLNETQTLEGFNDYLELSIDEMTKNSDSGINIMTIHKAKGLEFDCVFIPGVHNGNFPDLRFINTKEELEPERRLLYVAITRAKDYLFLSSSTITNSHRVFIDGFISEIVNGITGKVETKELVSVPKKEEISNKIISKNKERYFEKSELKLIKKSDLHPIIKNVLKHWVIDDNFFLSREIQIICENTEKIISDISRNLEPPRALLSSNRTFIYSVLKSVLDEVFNERATKITSYLPSNSLELIQVHKAMLKTKKVTNAFAPTHLTDLKDYKNYLDALHHQFEKDRYRSTQRNLDAFNNQDKSFKISIVLSPLYLLNSITNSNIMRNVENILKKSI